MQVSVALCGQQQQKLNQAEIHYKAGARGRNVAFNCFKTWLSSQSAQDMTI